MSKMTLGSSLNSREVGPPGFEGVEVGDDGFVEGVARKVVRVDDGVAAFGGDGFDGGFEVGEVLGGEGAGHAGCDGGETVHEEGDAEGVEAAGEEKVVGGGIGPGVVGTLETRNGTLAKFGSGFVHWES